MPNEDPIKFLTDGVERFLGALDPAEFDALIARSRPPSDAPTDYPAGWQR